MGLRIALTGVTGQVGRAVMRAAEAQGHTLIPLDRQSCDFANEADSVRAALRTLPEIDGLIHAAAFTDVDGAESAADLAFRVNAEGPELCAEFCAERDIALVHISTDYVFNGRANAPYEPAHPLSPINVYGQTKAIGELSVMNLASRAAILRASWVFDGVGQNFFTSMMRLGAERETLNVVSDQIGRPTHTSTLAQAALMALSALAADNDETENLRSIFHVSNSGDPVSWAEFANTIFALTSDLRNHTVTVNPITTEAYGAPAARPAYSVLNTQSLIQTLGVQLPDWRDMVMTARGEFEQAKQGD